MATETSSVFSRIERKKLFVLITGDEVKEVQAAQAAWESKASRSEFTILSQIENGQRWATLGKVLAMISLTTNTRGKTVMSKSIEEMSGPELVAEFNRLSSTKVKKFKDRASGIKRIKSLAGSTPAKKEEKEKPAGIVGEFGVRENSNRAKLLKAPGTDKQVPVNTLLTAVYGASKEEMKSALTMVMKGLSVTIAANKLKYEIKREKNKESGVSYGLYRS